MRKGCRESQISLLLTEAKYELVALESNRVLTRDQTDRVLKIIDRAIRELLTRDDE